MHLKKMFFFLFVISSLLPIKKIDANTDTTQPQKGLPQMEMHPTDIQPLELSKAAWRKRLTPEQFEVLRDEGTEKAFTSPLDKEKRDGYFVCAGCNLALFHSHTKYDSKTGWPSFWDVIPGRVTEKTDLKLILPRTEYHCSRCGGHQGHVFDDGPGPTEQRYCNNGQALKFVPTNKAAKEVLLAGGCFWCMQKPYDHLRGIITTVVGFTGGQKTDPTYKQVTAGGTGHYEAIQVIYDPDLISYDALLDTFWVNIDPLDAGGQFCDRGHSYKSALFYKGSQEKKIAKKSLKAVAKKLAKTIKTPLLKATVFYPAETSHQRYYLKNPWRYKFYRSNCGRDKRLMEIWGKAHMEDVLF